MTAHPDPAPPRRERVERQEPVHRLGRRRPDRQGRAEAVRGGRAAVDAGLLPDVVHTSRAAAGDQHRVPRPRRRRPALDPGPPVVAAQRAPLRRAAGQGQEADARAVRRGAVHALAPLVRRAAAAARRRRRVLAGPATRATPTSATSCRAPSASRTSSNGSCPTGSPTIVPDLRAGQDGAGRRPRQQPARPGQAPRRDQRRGHRRAEHPDRDAAGLPARRRHWRRRSPAASTSTPRPPPRPPPPSPTRVAERPRGRPAQHRDRLAR